MNLIEATQNFIARLTGIADRMDSALRAQETSSVELAEANARITELETAVPDVNRISEMEGQISALTARAETAEASLAEANEQLGTFDERVTEAANAEAARIVAGNGHAPVSTISTTEQEEKKPGDGLTGLRKATAILEAKMPKPSSRN